jgi:hypothetical protein
MPHIDLEVSTDSPGYAQLCRRALVDAPGGAGDRDKVRVIVLDRAHHSDLPAPDLVGPTIPNRLADDLAARGHNGAVEADYGLWQSYDPAARIGLEAQAAPGQFPPWVASFPLRNFLHWAYQAQGRRIVHAGTLGTRGKGVMLIGAGGSGKSGTTLSGILGGLDSVGDDYIAMDLANDRVRAEPVIKLVKQDANGLRRLNLDPVALGLGEVNWQGKYEFDFEVLGRGRRPPSLDLEAILMPRVAGAERSRFTPASPRVAMIALAPSNWQQLPGGWREGMTFTATIARRLPAYYLDLSTNGTEIAETIGRFIERGGP